MTKTESYQQIANHAAAVLRRYGIAVSQVLADESGKRFRVIMWTEHGEKNLYRTYFFSGEPCGWDDQRYTFSFGFSSPAQVGTRVSTRSVTKDSPQEWRVALQQFLFRIRRVLKDCKKEHFKFGSTDPSRL